ncbi:unnamed protein product [Toxocara canis]|uniref:Uncharacterized protein n=1 Tax=Toxocara canis TaxID=6265 RepID=A0A3P7EXF2_TOXCA|nr:unnamed protein product [Toxocara canis]
MLRELLARRVLSLGSLKTGSALGELVDESDIDKWASEPEPNVDFQRGPWWELLQRTRELLVSSVLEDREMIYRRGPLDGAICQRRFGAPAGTSGSDSFKEKGERNPYRKFG